MLSSKLSKQQENKMKKSEILNVINKHLAGEMRKNVTVAGVKNMSRADIEMLRMCLLSSRKTKLKRWKK